MNNNEINILLESCPAILNGLNRFGYVISLDRQNEYIQAGIYSKEICNFLEHNPEGKTEIYIWETRKVDYLVNVTISKIAYKNTIKKDDIK